MTADGIDQARGPAGTAAVTGVAVHAAAFQEVRLPPGAIHGETTVAPKGCGMASRASPIIDVGLM
jgi:hypothetical protein